MTSCTLAANETLTKRFPIVIWVVHVALSLLLLGCANPPTQANRSVTLSTDTLGPSAIQSIATHSLDDIGASGFQLLPVASNAYATRIELVAQAQHSLDVQYYLVGNDDVGHGFLRALRDAAMRGVRVRLLVDDLYTTGEDPILSLLNKHPNVEVRLFNPFTAGRSSTLSRFLLELNRVSELDHRMHNKMFVADGAVAILGGRNMADDYFMRRQDGNFVDLDVLAVGSIVRQVETTFDTYWNSAIVYPLSVVVDAAAVPNNPFDAFEELASNATPAPKDNVPEPMLRYARTVQQLRSGKLELTKANAELFADPADKAARTGDPSMTTVRDHFQATVGKATHDVTLISPYFIPGKAGVERMKAARSRGVEITVLTNSLASNDVTLAHLGYSRYREDMARIGVRLYELSPKLTHDRNLLGRFRTSLGKLHGKVALIDKRYLFVGSMNLDDRSEYKNTEVAILIDSPDLCAQINSFLDFDSAYRVVLSPDGNLQWRAWNGDTFDHDPETSVLKRFEIRALRPFVPDSEL